MGISILITVYNKADYLEKCLDSILPQLTTEDECLICNDASTDQSDGLIQPYLQKYPQIQYYQNDCNQGVSQTRNQMITKISCSYFTFIDSDDYVSPNFLQTLRQTIHQYPHIDVISFQMAKDNHGIITTIPKAHFPIVNGYEALIQMVTTKGTFDTPVCYVYRTQYFHRNHFIYPINCYHEDFRITPIVIMKANQVIGLNDVLYYNVQSDNSIMRNHNLEKINKKAYDFLAHFDALKKEVQMSEMSPEQKDILMIYLVDTMIRKWHSLPKQFQKQYHHELQKRKLWLDLPKNNLKRQIKRFFVHFCYHGYLWITT